MKFQKKKCRTLVGALAIPVLMFHNTVFAEVLTVPAGGESVTISADASYDSISVAGELVVDGAVLTSSGALELTGGTVRLSNGATLSAAGVTASSAASAIEFNGGRLVLSDQIMANGVNLALRGNEGDVLIDFNSAKWKYAFAAPLDGTGATTVSGNHAFVLSLAKCPNGAGLVQRASFLTLGHTGRTEIRGGMLYADFDRFPNTGELFIAGDATLSIGGMWLTVGSLTGPGTVTGESGGQVKISVPSGATGCCYSRVDSVLKLVKDGDGVLKTIGVMPSSFAVNGGEVRTAKRSEVGYTEFKFKVDGVGVADKTGMQLNELAFFSGEEDVTAGYSARSFGKDANDDIWNGDKVFDKKDATKWWYTYSADPSFGKAWVSVTYPERRIITGYKLKSQDWGGDMPNSWRLFGRDVGGEWELIDEKKDEPTVPAPGYNWSPTYAVSYAANPGATVCSAIVLAKGTSLSVPAGTSFSCASLTDNGALFSFASGSAVDIGVPENFESKSIIGSGVFAKSGAADMVSYGTVAPEVIRVKEGCLALRTPVALKEWKLAIGDVYDASGNEFALGEFAVYDQDSNRLNVTGFVTMASRSSSFSSTQAAYLYDGKDNSQAWVNWTDLKVKRDDEATWPWTSFTLADGAPAVAGYNLRTATYVSKGRPKTWKLYARATSSDAWILIDEKTDVVTPASSHYWYDGTFEWPGKAAWMVSSASKDTLAAFSQATSVVVEPGATLDLTAAARTQIGDIRIDGDAEGYGTIRGGALAESGTVHVEFAGNLPPSPCTLPLKIDGVDGAAALRNWTLSVNGKVLGIRYATVRQDGMVEIRSFGFVMEIR